MKINVVVFDGVLWRCKVDGLWIGKDVEWSDRGLITGIISEFSWRKWGKRGKFSQAAGLRAQISTQDLSNLISWTATSCMVPYSWVNGNNLKRRSYLWGCILERYSLVTTLCEDQNVSWRAPLQDPPIVTNISSPVSLEKRVSPSSSINLMGGSWDLARLLQQLLQSWTWNLKGVGGWNRWPLPTSKFLFIKK